MNKKTKTARKKHHKKVKKIKNKVRLRRAQAAKTKSAAQ
jgi:hypothetical protein